MINEREPEERTASPDKNRCAMTPKAIWAPGLAATLISTAMRCSFESGRGKCCQVPLQVPAKRWQGQGQGPQAKIPRRAQHRYVPRYFQVSSQPRFQDQQGPEAKASLRASATATATATQGHTGLAGLITTNLKGRVWGRGT